jgi:O-antigen/teichoic acid export membrane protein
MVTVGAAHHTIWALVAGGLVASSVTTVLSHVWLTGPGNGFQFDKGAFKELVDFGKWIFLSSAVGALAINGDRLFLGAVVDAHVLGMYAIAVLIVGAVEEALSKLLVTVSLPALSELSRKDPSRLRDTYYKLRLPADLGLLFVAGFLFASGQLLVDLLYDVRYAGAGHMLQILALSLFTDRYGVAHQLYLAVGLPRNLAIINAVRFASLFCVMPLAYYFWGANGAIWGIALHGLLTIPLVYLFNGRLHVTDVFREIVVLAALPTGILCGHLLTVLFA